MNLNTSRKKTATMTSAALTGMMVGAAVGMAAKSMMKPKKRKLAKSASKAIGAVGESTIKYRLKRIISISGFETRDEVIDVMKVFLS